MPGSTSVRHVVVFLAATILPVLLLAVPAVGAVGVSTSLSVPSPTEVGQDINGSFTAINTNNPPNQAESDALTQVRITPSCGSPGTVANPCPTPDPNVFSVVSATGAAGTACAGVTFTPGGSDVSGSIVLTPSTPVTLGPPGGAAGTDRCTVNFTLRALKAPAIDSNPGQAAAQTRIGGRAQVTSSVSGLSVASFSSVEVTVLRATPTLTTQAGHDGNVISDTATVTFPAAAAPPTGTVTFTAFGPNNATCSGPPFAQSTNPIGGGTATTRTGTSGAFPVQQAGAYRFVAVYSGDANHNSVTSPCNAPNEITVVAAEERVADFDGNGTTDIAVFRPSNGVWYLRTPSPTALVWGQNGDIPVPGDYDGNGTTDLAVFRPANNVWYLRTASPAAFVWGEAGDIPVPGDYDGNGTTDIAVFRPSNGVWYLRTPSPTALVWGQNGDIPVPGDYDGNGTTDLAVFRPANNVWYLRTASPAAFVWGEAGDVPVPGDYDGNGTTDIAVFRPPTGTWHLRIAGLPAIVWGQNGDVPQPGDYDGDGTTDLAVFRPSNSVWYLRTATPTAAVWGEVGDLPLSLPEAIRRLRF